MTGSVPTGWGGELGCWGVGGGLGSAGLGNDHALFPLVNLKGERFHHSKHLPVFFPEGETANGRGCFVFFVAVACHGLSLLWW